MMRKIVGLLRFISLASLGLLFNGIAAYLIFNLNPESLTLSWLAVVVCAPLGLNAWYCLSTGKQAWLTRLGPLP